ncbi:MAG TPA: magnesium transporter CorA family protein [Bacteroidota bacterium]|nr:magnesium transporter CorA family protein [Bacteroidota bacterium]
MLKKFNLVNNALVPSDVPESPVLIFINPDASEAEMLKREFEVDEHSLLSALDPDEESRAEIDGETIAMIWKRPMNYSGQDNFYFNVASVGLFLAKGRLAMVLTEDVSITPTGARRAQKLGTPLDLMLAFLYETIHHYLEHLKVIKMIARDLQQKINTSMENKHLIQMFNLSESLVYYANAINGNNAVLTRLKSHAEKTGLAERIPDLLDDLIIENNQCFRQTEIYATVFSGLMDARGSLVNNNMNVLLKNLTIINIVFLPLNLVAGIGGMSEFTLWTSGIDWRVSYTILLVTMLLIGWLTAFLLGRMGFAQPMKRKRVHKRKSPFQQHTPGTKNR